MIAGLVFNCGGCGVRLQVIAEGKGAFAAQLESASRETGRRIVALRNDEMDAWALLADEDNGVVCPQCRHRNLLMTPTGEELN